MLKTELKDIHTVVSSDVPLIVTVNSEEKSIGKTCFFISDSFDNGLVVKAKMKAFVMNSADVNEFEVLTLTTKNSETEEKVDFTLNQLNESVFFEEQLELSGEFAELEFILKTEYDLFCQIELLQVGVI
jgi:hypothetical protein